MLLCEFCLSILRAGIYIELAASFGRVRLAFCDEACLIALQSGLRPKLEWSIPWVQA